MITNKNAIFEHINNYQLKAILDEIDQKMKGETLQIMVTASQNKEIAEARKEKRKANIQHAKLAVLGHFGDGKALNPDDARLARITAAIISKYSHVEYTEDGYLQTKGAPKMVDAAIKVTPKIEPKQAEKAEAEQVETAPKETKKSSKKADKVEEANPDLGAA